jgi:nucleotide-binding universal stress UspA family protein
MTSTYRIVVGVDGTDGGRRALRWAVREAAARGGTVQAVTTWTKDGYDLPVSASSDPREANERAREILDREVETLGNGAGVTIASEVVEGNAAEVLTAVARDADLLVLGSHGHSHVLYTVLGSVSEACVRRATCPVVVIPVETAKARESVEPATALGLGRPQPTA